MSYDDGWAALNLEMPKRVPRTEYSAENHWDLVRKVTGIEVNYESLQDIKTKASICFVQKWNYDIIWSVAVSREIFGEVCSCMGHAEYVAGGRDFSDKVKCPFGTAEEVLDFDPWEAYGKKKEEDIIAHFEQCYKKNCETYTSAVNMTGVYVTCISGLIEIFGWDMLLLSFGVDAKRFGEMTIRYSSWIQQYFNSLAQTDIPVIMVHDDIVWTTGPFVVPSWYREYVFPIYRNLFSPLIDSGKKVLYTSDGNYTEFIDDIVETGVHGFVLEPSTDMKYLAEKYGKTHVFIGNADTRILLNGNKKQIRSEVKRCMDIGKKYPGFFMAVGNHIPANTPVDNAIYYNQIYEELSQRD